MFFVFSHQNFTLHPILNKKKKKLKRYLGIKAHSILGGFVEFGVFQHVFFPTRSLKYPQSERRQSSKDLRKQTQSYISCEIDSFSRFTQIFWFPSNREYPHEHFSLIWWPELKVFSLFKLGKMRGKLTIKKITCFILRSTCPILFIVEDHLP